MTILTTKRLTLRLFDLTDIPVMTQINQDPLVMRYFPTLLDKKQTNLFIQHIIAHQVKYGYALYAVELNKPKTMIGFVGLLHRTKADLDLPFIPATEIAWRLAADYWNQGYATEAANAVIDYAFKQLAMTDLISFAVAENIASRRVMEKIGMTYCPDEDFDHPKLINNSTLRHHVLYRIHR